MSNGASKASTSSGFHLVAGLGSGFTSAVLLQPADLLKTRVQQSGSNSLTRTLREILHEPRPLRELWRGTLPSVIRTSVGSALYFTTLTQLRKKLAASRTFTYVPDHSDNARFPAGRHNGGGSSALPKLAPTANLLAGAFSRASIGFLLMPITVLKVRYESSLFKYDSLLAAFRDVFRREGVKGFFSGFGATAIRDAPYAGLYVLLYEQGKKVLNNAVPSSAAADSSYSGSTSTSSPPAWMGMSTSASINFASSVMAASGATFITNPPDAIKTRLQLQPQKYKNTIFALKLMLREDGLRSLFDGLALRMARKAMSSALAWTVYEECIRWAERRLT